MVRKDDICNYCKKRINCVEDGISIGPCFDCQARQCKSILLQCYCAPKDISLQDLVNFARERYV